MAARLLLICVAFTVGLISGKSIGLNLGVIEGGEVVVGVRSHRLLLRCAPSPQAQVEWTHNDVPIPKGDPRTRRYVADNGSLVITKVVHNKKKGETDAGIYQCKVSNSEGAVLSSPVKVAVAGMAHEFSLSPSNTTIAEGNLLKLSCYIESTPKANITWFKDGEPLLSNKRIYVTESELFIPNVKFEDAGFYSCNASNILINKKRSSHVGEVTVMKQSNQPIALFLPEGRPDPHRPHRIHTTLRYGERRHLICAASGIPRPNVRWIHSKPDGANETSNSTQNGLKVFTIDSIDEENEGVYTCTATQTVNGVTSSISKIVEVDVEVPPVIVVKPKSQMYPAAKTVRIDCEVRGSPTPIVIWYKDGVKLHINGRIKQKARELVLGAAVTQDTGVYQCFANNSAGVATAYGRVVIISSVDKPAPPTGLSCKPLSSTQVSLSWNQLGSGLRAFSVHYFPTDGGDEGKDLATNDSSIVDKLEPHTNYTFYVRSYNSKSASEQSKRVICKTDEAVPTGAPKVTLTTSSSQCVTVKWEPPTLALARGTIVSYEIQWKKTTQTSSSFIVVPGSTLEYVISGLRGNTEYLVRVIGATSLGWPELNEFQAPFYKITTPSDRLSQLQSPSVQLYSVNSTLIEVLWKYENDSSIDGFKVNYRNSIDIDDSTTFPVPPFERSFFIPVKEPSKWHDVSVRAYRESSDGQACLIRYFSEGLLTYKPTLSVPSDLDAFPMSQNTINVTWTFSTSEMNLHSIRFTVHYSAMHTNNSSTSNSLMETLVVFFSNRTFALIHGLKPRTYYKISVQAHGPHNMISPLSNLIACKTLPEVVGLVDNISWKVLSNTSVEMSWNPLPFPVTGYTVFYNTRLTADQADQWQQVSVTDNRTSIKLLDLKSNMDYVVRIRGESGLNHGPMSADTYISLPMEDKSYPNGHIHPTNTRPSDQFLGIVVGISISICCIALCTGSLLYRKKCTKPEAQGPSSLSVNGQSSAHCEQSSLASIEMKDIQPTSPVNGMKLPLISNGTLPNGNNREKIVRITDNPQGLRGERSSSHSTDEGDSLLSGPELDMEPEEPTQITLLVDSSLMVVAPTKETAPDDGFHETHIAAQQW